MQRRRALRGRPDHVPRRLVVRRRSPTESASPSAEPATGKALKGPSFTARAPEGWKVDQGGASAALSTIYASEEDENASVTGFLRIADGPAFLDEPLPKLAKERAGSSEYQTKPEVLENVDVAGVEMYHVAGNVGSDNNIIDLGAIVGENLVEIHIESDARTPEELQEVLDSVLASWQWS